MSHHLPMKKSLRFFTMIEMITVITIASILLTISVSLSRPDSTKANVSVVGGALNYAQSHAMNNLTGSNEYTVVSYSGSGKEVHIFKVDTSTGATDHVLTKRFIEGSTVLNNGTADNDFAYAFNEKGLPFVGNSAWKSYVGDEFTDTIGGTTVTPIISVTSIAVENKSDSQDTLAVYIKPFTGKIAYYN